MQGASSLLLKGKSQKSLMFLTCNFNGLLLQMGYKHLTGNLKTLIQILVLFLGNSFVLGSMLCSPLTPSRNLHLETKGR